MLGISVLVVILPFQKKSHDPKQAMDEIAEDLQRARDHLYWCMMAIVRVEHQLAQLKGQGKGDGKGNKGEGKGNKGDGKGHKGYGKGASRHLRFKTFGDRS